MRTTIDFLYDIGDGIEIDVLKPLILKGLLHSASMLTLSHYEYAYPVENPYIYPYYNHLSRDMSPNFEFRTLEDRDKIELRFTDKYEDSSIKFYYSLVGPYYEEIEYKISFLEEGSSNKIGPSIRKSIFIDVDEREVNREDLVDYILEDINFEFDSWTRLNSDFSYPNFQSNGDLEEIIFYYEKDKVYTYYKAEYLDYETGEEVSNPKYSQGEEVFEICPDIEGWTLVCDREKSLILSGDSDNTISFYFEKNASPKPPKEDIDTWPYYPPTRPWREDKTKKLRIEYIDIESKTSIRDSFNLELESLDDLQVSELEDWFYIEKDLEKLDNLYIVRYYYSKIKTHKPFIVGYEDGSLRPDDNITKEEVASVMARVLDRNKNFYDEVSSPEYKDLDSKDWAYSDIKLLSDLGIVCGYEGCFSPKDEITRAELASLISRFECLEPDNRKMSFKDIDKSWARAYINALYNNGIVVGQEEGIYNPDAKLTRAEFVRVVNNLESRKPFKITGYKYGYRDLIPGSWYFYDMLEGSIEHKYYELDGQGYWIEDNY